MSQDSINSRQGTDSKFAYVIKRNFNKVTILYFCTSESKYSGKWSVTERDRVGIYWKIVYENDENLNLPDINELNPMDFGYEISRITVNKKEMLRLTVLENMQKTYYFPQCHTDLAPHTIIHDVDEVVGFSNENF